MMAENPWAHILNKMNSNVAWLRQLVENQEHSEMVYVRHREFRTPANDEIYTSNHVHTHWIRVNGNERELALYMAFLDIVDTKCIIDKDVCEPESIVHKLVQLSPYGVHFSKEMFSLSQFLKWPIEEYQSHPDVTWKKYTRKLYERFTCSDHISWM